MRLCPHFNSILKAFEYSVKVNNKDVGYDIYSE